MFRFDMKYFIGDITEIMMMELHFGFCAIHESVNVVAVLIENEQRDEANWWQNRDIVRDDDRINGGE